MSHKILYVEDNPDNRMLVRRLLMSCGYEITEASSAREALEALKTLVPDLILMDINMPDMDGGDVCWHLSDDPVTKDIPVVFLSGMVTKEEEGDIRGHTCISKSSSIEETIKKLKVALGVPLK